MLAMAAVAAALAAWVGWPQRERRLQRRLEAPRAGASSVRRRGPARPAAAALAVVVAVLAAAVVSGLRVAALVLVAAVLVATITSLRARGRRRREVAAERRAVAAAADGVAGLLRVGCIPAVALKTLAREHPVLAEASAEHEIGGDVVAALRRSAVRPGREGLAELAAAWDVAARTGASLDRAVDVIADDLHGRQDRAATVSVELAASRLASRLLGVLPLAGIGLGYAFGGDPLAFLTAQPVGLACLVAAAGLVASGLLWTDALAARAGG